MQMINSKTFGLMASGLLFGFGAVGMQGCDDLAEQCGLTCPSKGIVEGNASISGVASIDAFFGAVVDYKAAADSVNSGIRVQLDAIAIGVGLEPGATGAEIKAGIQAKLDANISGSLTVNAQPAKCQASVEVAASAAAECDVEVDPGSIEVKCEGSCTIDASAQADCSAMGNLRCTGTAPNLECSGTCTGECNLEVAASCEGTCRGACDAECSVVDSSGNCAGQCMGNCQGSCELNAGGSCSGKCEGSCEYTPPGAECEANAEAKCTAAAEANVECKGGCEGDVRPPEVKAECKATVEAKAEASVECTPPSIDIAWQWKAGVDADAQAEFKAWINTFKGQLGGLLAATAKAEILVAGAGNLSAAANAAVKGGIEEIKASGDLKAKIGAGCALEQLSSVVSVLGGVGTSLQGSLSASVEITAMAGG
ncbi:MAG: hypothetical protein IPK80_16960 [Nannocystis sp.]|nr:hypothetical protein [Nannocystis sp.]